MSASLPLRLLSVVVALPASAIFTATHAKAQTVHWPDPVANDVVSYQSSGLTHGPMLGRPRPDGNRVWVRTADPMEFEVVFSKTLPLPKPGAGVRGRTTAENDNTGTVDLTGLDPDSRYFYGIVLDGNLADTRVDLRDPFPSFVTLPDETVCRDEELNPKGRFNFSFGVGFCNRQHWSRYRNPPAFSTLMREHGQKLRFFLMNGDYIYEDSRTRKNRPHPVELFREDYRRYLDGGRDMARFFRHVPTLFLYDDHETYSDLEGTGEIGLTDGKWLYRDLALGPWYEYAGWANFDGPQRQPILRSQGRVKKDSDILADPAADFTSLRREAVSNVHVWMGSKNAGVYALEEVIDAHRIRVSPPFRADEECAYSAGTHHYYDWQVGNCHFFAVDTRGERTRYLPEKARDPDRFLLGEKQFTWLTDGIRKSDADFIFIISTVPWMIYHTNFHVTENPRIVAGRSEKEDGFTGAVHERDRLLDFLDGLEKPVLIFTGDLHNAFVVQISDNVWEFMIGPLNSANHNIASAGNPPFGGWFDSEGTEVKIKWVSGFPNSVNYERLKRIFYGVVRVNNVMPSGRQDGPGYHWTAYDEPQVVVQAHDGYTGELIYAEGISTCDAKKERKVKKPSVR